MKTIVKKKTRKKPAPKMPREYSREFTKAPGDKGRIFKVRDIPSPFWEQVTRKATREGISLRKLWLDTCHDFLQNGGRS